MYKLSVFLCVTAVVVAQDLDSILLDIYGPDMNTNMINKNSGEMETDGANTDYAHPIPNDHQLKRRQVAAEGESCTVGEKVGRCVPYFLCTEAMPDDYDDMTASGDTCTNTVEICCPQQNEAVSSTS